MKRGNRVELNLGYAQMERLEKAAKSGVSLPVSLFNKQWR